MNHNLYNTIIVARLFIIGINSEELKNRYRQATDPRQARRWQLLWLISQKKTIKEASAVIGINYDYGRDIVKSYNQQGKKAMIEKLLPLKKKRPNHALLNADKLEELRCEHPVFVRTRIRV